MTGDQFRKLRLAAGLESQQAAAEFLHRSLRTVHGWENGEPIDPLVIDYLKLVAKIRPHG
jgi:DNA-binding transcriptional regulator YiaG